MEKISGNGARVESCKWVESVWKKGYKSEKRVDQEEKIRSGGGMKRGLIIRLSSKGKRRISRRKERNRIEEEMENDRQV